MAGWQVAGRGYGVGSRFRTWATTTSGTEVELETEVVDLVPLDRIVLHGMRDGARTTTTYRFEAKGSGTLLEQTILVEWVDPTRSERLRWRLFRSRIMAAARAGAIDALAVTARVAEARASDR